MSNCFCTLNSSKLGQKYHCELTTCVSNASTTWYCGIYQKEQEFVCHVTNKSYNTVK